MKTVLNKFLVIAGVAAFMLASCKKDGVMVKTNGGTAGTLNASVTTLVLQKSKINDTTKVVNFKFTNADYGYSSAVTTTLQIDVPADNWASPQSVTLAPKILSQGYSTIDFNALLLKLNLPAGKASQVAVRVMYSVTSSLTPVYSNVVAMTVTPFSLVSYVYVPGAYQGWDISKPDSLQSATSNGIYTGIINFTGSASSDLQFKITPLKNWDNSYGLDASGNFKYNPNPGYAATGGNLIAPGSGQYWITVNINTGTITYAKADYFSIIGDAPSGTAWSTDTDMKFNNGTRAWEVVLPLTAHEFKVRMNHDWGNSYGIPKTGADGATLNNNDNNNITVSAAGTYKVTFTVAYSTDPDKLGKYDSSINTAAYTLVKQ